jgi:hypothetical protein
MWADAPMLRGGSFENAVEMLRRRSERWHGGNEEGRAKARTHLVDHGCFRSRFARSTHLIMEFSPTSRLSMDSRPRAVLIAVAHGMSLDSHAL